MHPLTDYIPTVIFIAAAVAIPSDPAIVETLAELPEPEIGSEIGHDFEVRLWGPEEQRSDLFSGHSFARAVDDPDYAYAFEDAYRKWLETGLEPRLDSGL